MLNQSHYWPFSHNCQKEYLLYTEHQEHHSVDFHPGVPDGLTTSAENLAVSEHKSFGTLDISVLVKHIRDSFELYLKPMKYLGVLQQMYYPELDLCQIHSHSTLLCVGQHTDKKEHLQSHLY